MTVVFSMHMQKSKAYFLSENVPDALIYSSKLNRFTLQNQVFLIRGAVIKPIPLLSFDPVFTKCRRKVSRDKSDVVVTSAFP